MLVYKIEKKKHQKTYPPKGSQFAKGRWSTKDMWIVYTSENISLAKLETLANAGAKIPEERFLLTLEVGDTAPLVEITIADLPDNWAQSPYPRTLAQMIREIMNTDEYIGAIVPSAQSFRENNILLFPEHPDFDKYVRKIDESDEYFDPRLK